MNALLYTILVILYGVQFYIDTLVFSYPSKSYDGKKELGLLFNKQKKLSFLVRVTVNLTYPLAAYLVDISYINRFNIHFINFMMISAVIGLLFARPSNLFDKKIKVDAKIKAGSLLYIFHFIGIPLSLIIAPMFLQYRATIVQLGVVLNTISTIAQVWLVDQRLSQLLKSETLEDLKAQVYFLWKYRSISKIIGVVLLVSLLINFY